LGWQQSRESRKKRQRDLLIPTDGKIRSQVFTTYYGWETNGTKCNLQSLISIDAGSRASRMELKADKNIDNIATGLSKTTMPNSSFQNKHQANGLIWLLLANKASTTI
jgi:hypothetical protein